MDISQTIELSLQPHNEDIAKALAFCSGQLDTLQSHADTTRRINPLHFRLALDEALLNAWKHGCKNAPHAVIRVVMRLLFDAVEVSVEDPGLGFPYAERRTDTEESFDQMMMLGIKKGKGWGLAIIQSFCRTVYWNERGNRLTMIFLRTRT